MPTTLTLTGTVPVTVTLDDELHWADEFDWSTTQARRGYSAGGAQLLDVGTKLAGRPITLTDPDNRTVTLRSTVLTLRSWTDDPAAVMTLLFRGTTYSVGWAAVEAPVTCTPLVTWSDPLAADLVVPTIRLITLE
jgi:hypothetical protein